MKSNSKSKKVILKSKYNLNLETEKSKIVTTSIGFDSRKFILTVSSIPERINGMFPQTQTKDLLDYSIIEIHDGSLLKYSIKSEKWSYHFLQPVADDKFLLACARTHYRNGDPEKNARIFDNSGKCISEFLLGDGLQDLKVTEDNNIWTSYFDEGIFGNYGWNEPLGYCGLRKWDILGGTLFEFNSDSYQKYIDDCYAMNVINDSEVWFYFYSDFLIGILNNNKIRFLEPGISGASCFLVHGQYVMFDKGYNQHGTFQVLKINGDFLKAEFDLSFEDIDGTPIIPQYIDYRGSEMIFVSNGKVYCYDLIEVYNY
jgi:hypothetical protein